MVGGNERRGMRCRKHPCEPGGVGVCASCLRERLLDLLAAQAKAEEAAADAGIPNRSRDMPLPFPRSVSPYVSSESRRSQRLFYSTQQLGPAGNRPACRNKPGNDGKFSIFATLFSSGKNKKENENDSSRVSSTWFSGLFPSYRKKKSRLFSLDISKTRASVEETDRKFGRRDRGMSPVRKIRPEEEEESGWETGYSSETSARSRMAAKKFGFQEEKLKRRVSQQQSPSGLAFFLSPLMRPSPNHRHHRHQSEQNGWDMSSSGVLFSGEIRNSSRKRFGPSFCTNRSRKLVDFGKYP